MIKIQPTENHIKNIKKHKKFLERWKLWSFAYFDGEEYFCNVAYYRGKIENNNITGYLILDLEGNIVPFEKAMLPLKYLVMYNSYIFVTGTDILKRVFLNTSPVQLMYQLITKYKSNILMVCPELTESVEKILKNNDELIKQPTLMKEIYQRIYDYQNKMLNEMRYFDQKLLKLIEVEIQNYREIMYKYGINEKGIREDYMALLKVLQSKNIDMLKKDKAKLIKLLNACIRSIDKDLAKSIETFEINEHGEKIEIDQNNLREELFQNMNRIGNRDLHEIFLPILRN